MARTIDSKRQRMPAARAEDELLERLRARDPDSFALLVREHGARIRAAIRRILVNEEDVSEAFQDALRSAFVGIAGFERRARLGTWLERIATNAARMKLRVVRRLRSHEVARIAADDDDANVPAITASEADDGALQAERAERRSTVHRCIAALPDSYRSAVQLQYVDGLDSREISGLLGITVGAAKLRIFRGRQVLRPCLASLRERCD